jgi:hypothetical protein
MHPSRNALDMLFPDQAAMHAHAACSPATGRAAARRRDGAARLSAAEAAARGGGGCILLERVLPELAFKLGRAPKYGA